MTEFIVIFPLVLLLVLGIMQFGFLYTAKSTLNLATFDAARSAAVNHAQRLAVDMTLADGLAALYTQSPDVKAFQAARQRVYDDMAKGYVCVQRISPNTDMFQDFARKDDNNEWAIPNDNLIYRSRKPGLNSTISIQDANLLKIRVSYCYPMIVPFIRTTIAALADHNTGKFQHLCYSNGRFPLVAKALVRMQSDAYKDPDFARSCK